MKPIPGLLSEAQKQVQALAMALIALAALAMLVLTIGAALGALPWVEIYASAGGTQIARAGMYGQIALTVLLLLLAFYLPAARRVMRLESHHRDFSLSMEDVARAYRLSHEMDRKKLFRIGSEFDSVRDRIQQMRDHPDLAGLEPEILELAAQMSHTSRDLAKVYSEETVSRAKSFLAQRQQEVDRYLENVAIARKTTEDLRHWMLQIETEEALAERQIAALEADLMDLLPELGFEVGAEVDPPDTIVVPMTQKHRGPTRPTVPSKPDW